MSLHPVHMPGLSDTMQSGRLLRWLKKPGDAVHKGEALAEIESDKAIMDLEAFDDGYLAGPLAKEEADYPVGATLAWISDEADSHHGNTFTAPSKEHRPAPAETVPSSPPEVHDDSGLHHRQNTSHAGPTGTPGSAPASPRARALARELGIDLGQLQPGPGGIIKSPQVIAAALRGPQPDLDAGPPWRYKLLTPMRRSIADNMTATLHTPCFHATTRLQLDALSDQARTEGQSLSLLLARALALSVAQHPEFNAVWTPQGLAVRQRVDVGIAVELPGGLVTPVVRDMAQRPWKTLEKDWQRLRHLARQQRLRAEDYLGATVYLSNLGMFPSVERFQALLPLGASAILAIAAARDGQAEATLTADHRVVYGTDAARFLQTLGACVKDPQALIRA